MRACCCCCRCPCIDGMSDVKGVILRTRPIQRTRINRPEVGPGNGHQQQHFPCTRSPNTTRQAGNHQNTCTKSRLRVYIHVYICVSIYIYIHLYMYIYVHSYMFAFTFADFVSISSGRHHRLIIKGNTSASGLPRIIQICRSSQSSCHESSRRHR